MNESTLLVAPEAPSRTPVRLPWLLVTLLAIVLLERLCAGALQTALGLGLLAPFGYSLATTQELLVGISLLNASMMLVGGWLGDVYWGVQRLLLVGALLVVTGYGALAAVLLGNPAVLGGDNHWLFPLLLALPAIRSGLLLPGLFVAVGALERVSLPALARNFLLMSLMAGLANVILPLGIGAVEGQFNLAWIVGGMSCLAALLVLLLLRYRHRVAPAPSVSSPSPVRQIWGVLLSLILLLGAVSGLTKTLSGLLGLLFLSTLGYLAWSAITAQHEAEEERPPRKLLARILGVFGLSLLLAVATKVGYTVAPEPVQLLLWTLVPSGALLGLWLWTRREAGATSSYKLWTASLALARIGAILVLLLLLQQWAFGAGIGSVTVGGLVATLPLHTAITCLLFLLPILISLYGPATAKVRLMALVLVLGSVASELATGLVALFWPH